MKQRVKKSMALVLLLNILIFSISDAMVTVYEEQMTLFLPIHLWSGNTRLHSKSCKKNMKFKPATNKQYKSKVTFIAAASASSKLPSELTTSPSMYKSQQTFPSTTIRDDISIAAPEMRMLLIDTNRCAANSMQCSQLYANKMLLA
jgi:hypothetical protein